MYHILKNQTLQHFRQSKHLAFFYMLISYAYTNYAIYTSILFILDTLVRRTYNCLRLEDLSHNYFIHCVTISCYCLLDHSILCMLSCILYEHVCHDTVYDSMYLDSNVNTTHRLYLWKLVHY